MKLSTLPCNIWVLDHERSCSILFNHRSIISERINRPDLNYQDLNNFASLTKRKSFDTFNSSMLSTNFKAFTFLNFATKSLLLIPWIPTTLACFFAWLWGFLVGLLYGAIALPLITIALWKSPLNRNFVIVERKIILAKIHYLSTKGSSCAYVQKTHPHSLQI